MSNEESPTGGTARRSARQGAGGSPVGSTVGIVLAVVAVVAGFLILRSITDDSDGGGSSLPDTSTTDAPTTTAGGTSTTSTTTPQLVTEGATVVVANASGVSGSAGRMSEQLADEGFTMGTATNATVRLDESVVYFDGSVASAQAVAESVATVLGGLTVEAVPSPPPTEDGTMAGGGVLVLLGANQADKSIADLSGTGGADATTPADTTETGTAPAPSGGTATTTG